MVEATAAATEEATAAAARAGVATAEEIRGRLLASMAVERKTAAVK